MADLCNIDNWKKTVQEYEGVELLSMMYEWEHFQATDRTQVSLARSLGKENQIHPFHKRHGGSSYSCMSRFWHRDCFGLWLELGSIVKHALNKEAVLGRRWLWQGL